MVRSFLEIKKKNLIVNKTNKNDIIQLLRSTNKRVTFDNDMWIYIERTNFIYKIIGQN